MQNTTQVAEFNNAWKGRGTLANMVDELKRQKASRVDFVADIRNFHVGVHRGEALPDGKSHLPKRR